MTMQNRCASTKEFLHSNMDSHTKPQSYMRSANLVSVSITTSDTMPDLYLPYLIILQYGFRQRILKYQELLLNKLLLPDPTYIVSTPTEQVRKNRINLRHRRERDIRDNR